MVIADEVRPQAFWQWLPYIFIRLPLALLTMLWTQSTTHALSNLHGKLEDAGFSVVHQEEFLLGSLVFLVVQKEIDD